MENALIKVLEKVSMDLRKKIRRQGERAARKQLRDALADQICFPVLKITCGLMVAPDQSTRLFKAAIPPNVGFSRIFQILRSLKPINFLKPDGNRPIVPASRFGFMLRSRFVSVAVWSIRGHGGAYSHSTVPTGLGVRS